MPRGVSTFPRHLEHFRRIEDDTVPSLSRLRSNMVTCGRHENMQENMKRGFRGTGLARKLITCTCQCRLSAKCRHERVVSAVSSESVLFSSGCRNFSRRKDHNKTSPYKLYADGQEHKHNIKFQDLSQNLLSWTTRTRFQDASTARFSTTANSFMGHA